jgi:hypothetical protein
MVSENERAKILEMIEEGTITAEQGLALLSALGESGPALQESDPEETASLAETLEPYPTASRQDESEKVAPDSGQMVSKVLSPSPEMESQQETLDFTPQDEPFQEPQPFDVEAKVMGPEAYPPDPEEMERWKRWWVIPFWIGAGITVIGGLLMYWAFSASGMGFWFACAWFPFLLGVATLALGWGSRTTPWLHVRVHQAPGETPKKIAISFPIPIRLTAWGLKTFGHFIPHMEGTNLDEVILALKDISLDGTPLFVDVNEGENGEHVQVFIG